MYLSSATGHKPPFRPILAECRLSPIPAVHRHWKGVILAAAIGQKLTFRNLRIRPKRNPAKRVPYARLLKAVTRAFVASNQETREQILVARLRRELERLTLPFPPRDGNE
jgi:hypothetical protein